MSSLSSHLRTHVDVLAELIGERNSTKPHAIEAARTYLRKELSAMGHTFVDQSFENSQRRAVNLEVCLLGQQPRKPTLVIGAHYDSAYGTPGADDNASAVAILLEVARSLKEFSPKRKLRIVFYDCEEPPHFNLGEMGSQFHAASLRRAGEKLLGMICLESLGYFPVRTHGNPFGMPFPLRLANRIFGGRYVVIVSDMRSLPFNLQFLARYFTSGIFPTLPAAMPVRWVPDIALSDHRGYWEQGYPALMITDTAHLRNPNYHRHTDRLATLDIDRMAKLCRMLQRTIQRLCA